MKKKNNTIFTVNVMYVGEEGKMIRHRTWGYYFDYKKAEEAVLGNYTDLFENNFYNYALINEMPPGIPVLPVNYSLKIRKNTSGWFKAVYSKKSSEPKIKTCKQPLPAGHVFVWG